MSTSPLSAIVVSGDPALAGALAAVLNERFDIRLLGFHEISREDAESETCAVAIVDVHNAPIRPSVARIADSMATLVLGPDDPESMIEAVEAGALGYLAREAPLKDIEKAAFGVAQGTATIPPFMLGTLLQHMVRRQRAEVAAIDQLDALTNRELEVFHLAAVGLNHESVADRLFISPATARTHLHRIFKKLEVHSKAELVALAAACGIPTSEES